MIEKVTINVGGQTFVANRSTFHRYTETKLSNISFYAVDGDLETCDVIDKYVFRRKCSIASAKIHNKSQE